MQRFIRPFALALITGWLLLSGHCGWAQAPTDLVITHVTVLTMHQPTILRHHTVLIQQGIVRAIGPTGRTKFPRGTRVLDGTGKYLLPGLVDMHAHLPGKEGTAHDLTTYFRLQLAAGVVALRSMRGEEAQLHWRDSLRRTAALAPRLYLGSPVITRDKRFSAAQAQALLTRYRAAGYDFAKYLGGLTAPQFDSLLFAAKTLGIQVAGHAPRGGLAQAVAAGLRSIEHMEPFVEAYQRDSVQFRQLAHQMAGQHLFTCPDLYWYHVAWQQYSKADMLALPGNSYVDPRLRGQWEAWWDARQQQLAPQGIATPAHAQQLADLTTYNRALRILRAEGVQFLVSPGDGPFIVPGFGMAEELSLLVAAGLTPYEALRAATYNAAAWFGEQNHWGSIAPGQRADLVLLEANPLEDIRHIRRVNGVVLNGRWLPLSQLLPTKE